MSLTTTEQPMQTVAQQTQAPAQQAPAAATVQDVILGSVRRYLDQLRGATVANLYELVLDEVREPMLREVLKHLRGNQSAAARLMGISRGTLRKLMKRYGMLD